MRLPRIPLPDPLKVEDFEPSLVDQRAHDRPRFAARSVRYCVVNEPSDALTAPAHPPGSVGAALTVTAYVVPLCSGGITELETPFVVITLSGCRSTPPPPTGVSVTAVPGAFPCRSGDATVNVIRPTLGETPVAPFAGEINEPDETTPAGVCGQMYGSEPAPPAPPQPASPSPDAHTNPQTNARAARIALSFRVSL